MAERHPFPDGPGDGEKRPRRVGRLRPGGRHKAGGLQVVARVEADPETFLWSSAGGATSFVRRERLQSVLAVLAAEGCVPVAVYCTDAAADFGQAAGVYARQLGDTLGWAYARPPDARSIGRRPGAGEAAGISGAGVVPAVAWRPMPCSPRG